ncbi:MAG TPA: filamentous hemagglutinin family protein [Bradyrhizobium sp.]|nr:filamentous hemagglutinin family protein [Bradyrhizobium sp.]
MNQRGTIHLLNSASDATGSVTLTGNAVSAILPELDTTDTALNSQRDALIADSAKQNAVRGSAASGQFDNLSRLADREDQSRIEIVSGNVVKFQNGSLTMAQGGLVAVSAGKRIFTETGSSLDVSGVQNVGLEMSSNQIQVNLQGNELRDSPQNRDSKALVNGNVWVDVRDLVFVPAGTGGYAADRYYTPGGLIEVAGYVNKSSHSIGEWTAIGGTITLSAPEVIAQQGASFNISGGSVQYKGGYLADTLLLGSDGRIYSVNNAPGNLTYTAVADGFVVNHPRAGVVEVYNNSLGGKKSMHWEDGYIVGRDAGRLILSTPTSVFEGNIVADVVRGDRQTGVRPSSVTDGYKLAQTTAALQGTLALGRYDGASSGGGGFYGTDVHFGDVAGITGGMAATGSLPSERTNTAWFDAGRINALHLGGLDVGTTETITIDRVIKLADGGRIVFTAPVVDIGADITARSGSMTVDNYFKGDLAGGRGPEQVLLKNGVASITLHDGATIDLRGLWVNAQDNPDDGTRQAFVDGGSVTLRSTHDVTIEKGSTIDVSSGAAILAGGKTKGGRGGNVSLIADAPALDVRADGLLTADGTIRAYGVNGGGTLKLESGTAVAIGGKVMANDDVLGAGEKAQADFVLARDYLVKAGETLPGDYTYQTTMLMPGDRVTNRALFAGVVLAADWTPPLPNTLRSYDIRYTLGGVSYAVRVWDPSEHQPVPVIPAGAVLLNRALDQIVGYTLPADVFRNGVPVSEAFTRTLTAGTIVTSDTVLAAGTRLSAGFAPARDAQIKPLLQLDTSLFKSGFANYDIVGHTSVAVAAGASLDVAMPVYRLGASAFELPSGTDPARALSLWTPPEWTEDARSGKLIQRGGASLSLRATQGESDLLIASGTIAIGTGASIQVDSGQSIRLQGKAFTIDGRLTAPGGTIDLTQPVAPNKSPNPLASGYGGTPDLIWIGDNAVLDVAARAVTAKDVNGRTYGVVGSAGSILIGGAMDWEDTGVSITPTAFVVIRPGALLDASGTSAVLDIATGGAPNAFTPVLVASDGGTIVVKAGHGLYLDGTMRAASGGVNAAGGTLGVALEALQYQISSVSGDVLRHRELVIADVQGSSVIADGLAPLDAKSFLVTGTARLGADRIAGGGFGNLSVLVDGVLSFDGDVSLAMAQSLRLYSGAIGLTDAAAADSRIRLAAPYVRLAGVNRAAADGYQLPGANWGRGGPSQRATAAAFGVAADLIDLRDTVSFSLTQAITTGVNDYTLDRRGFAEIDLLSRGDLRLLRAQGNVTDGTRLLSAGDVVLTAGQIYPATGASATITAGYVDYETIRAGSLLEIRRYGDVPEMPYAAFGSLSLKAGIVRQGGVVRAPFGNLTIGMKTGLVPTDSVTLLPGSITSVSGAGLVMPYGGTLDGITYSYNGSAVRLFGAGGLGSVNLLGVHVDARAGAIVDVSGGGELTGAGFVTGRGGSVNILTTPLVNANPGYGYSAKGNQVYAIVPSRGGSYAPVVQEAGYGAPAVGREITIPDGVPGLKAGTYMLMPSTYALLPGAYRVEIAGAAGAVAPIGVTATGNGSYVAGVTLGVANTAIRASLPVQAIITPADAVRTHSSFNEIGYNAFVLADAARIGIPRAALTIDARSLDIMLSTPRVADARPRFTFDSELRIDAAQGSGGFAGKVQLHGISEILANGQAPSGGLPNASVYADDISKLGASRLVLNGTLAVGYGTAGGFAIIDGDWNSSIILRSGAHLSAAEVIFAGKGTSDSTGSITIEEGASVATIGRGKAAFDSRDGYVFLGLGTLMVSNGMVDLQPGEYFPRSGYDVAINVGACVSAGCGRTTTLVSEGSIAVSTPGSFVIADNVAYGTRNLVLGVSGINLGDEASLAAAAAAGRLPAGLALNDAVLARLLAGNTAIGAPALEALALNARNAVNVFGNVTLDATRVGRLVLGTPAIYGYGASGDAATIRADEFVWTGSREAPGAPNAPALGDGSLTIAANRVVLGYGPNTRPDTTMVDNRIALGFSAVTIGASQSVTSNSKSTLSVYHSRGAYDAATGYAYAGGDLTISAPLLTGAAGSSTRITTGGDLRVLGTGAIPAPSEALGGQLTLSGANVVLDSSIVLPSGRLEVLATGDIVLGERSRLDLAGRAVSVFDVTKYSWGGDLVLTSSAGNIRQEAGSVIDLSARNNRGGTATVTALGGAAGHVALGGAVLGGSSGRYDAGGTLVPYDAAELTVQAQILDDFSGLNARLNAAGVFGARRFQIKQGDLVVGSEVKARNVEIVVDGGSLTIIGTIDASGEQVGSIRLAAMNDLTVAGLLDAHGRGMRFDSYGLIIDAPNRASIDLTAKQGTLTLSNGAAFDLRAGTDVTVGTGARRNDGADRGMLALNAPRLGGDDVAIDVRGTPRIAGAKTTAVYGRRSYDDAPLAAVPDITGHRPQEITQAYLDAIDLDSIAFMDAALGNAALAARLGALGSAHLRPGVDIVSRTSADNPSGDLTVNGDLDLSKYRYGPNADRVVGSPTYGFGEPGAINIRAAGNLNIRGTITDGFAPPPATKGDNGWRLEQGVVPFGGEIVLPVAVTIEAGTLFKQGAVLNYDLPTGPVTLPSGTTLPVRATLTAPLTLGRGSTLNAAIYNADGSLAYAAGTVMSSDVTLAAGMQLDAGSLMSGAVSVAALTWPKGVALPVNMSSAAQMSLAAGALIPSQTDVKLPGGTAVDLRDASGGRQGANWAVAAMLPAGAKSWDIQLTAGADLGSADARARNPNKTGNIVLADTHYASLTTSGATFANLNAAGAAALIAALGPDAGGLTVNDLVGKSEAEIVALLGGSSWQDFVDFYGLSPNFWTGANGNIELGLTMQGVLAVVAAAGGLPPGITDNSQLLYKTQNQLFTLYGDPNLTWADFGFAPDFAEFNQGNFGTISMPPATRYATPSFSLVRTGTGNLSLSAAGQVNISSLYGVYTAGTATTVPAAYNRPRGLLADGSLLGPKSADYADATALYQAWYPDQGGNVEITAGGDLTGDIFGMSSNGASATVVTGNWLWRQGTGTAAVTEAIPTAWWINFGAYVPSYPSGSTSAGELANIAGFTGIGALGGGNVSIRVGGQAGTIAQRGGSYAATDPGRSQGLVVAIGSTGRVGSDGSLTLTGGGDVDMRIAGALNPNLALTGSYDNQSLPGALIDLRGALHVSAQSLGGIKPIYNTADAYDPRSIDLYTATQANARSGLVVVPGDATITIETRGDLVLAGAGDPGRSTTPSNSDYTTASAVHRGGGLSWFSLWTDHTAINLVSAGGNLTPSTAASDAQTGNDGLNRKSDVNQADGSIVYPAILRAAALDGGIYYGPDALPTIRNAGSAVFPFVTLAPSTAGTLELIAGRSIYAGQYGISSSGSGTPLPSPFNPAFVGFEGDVLVSNLEISNLSLAGSRSGGDGLALQSLFAFGPNSAAVPLVRAADADPIRFYAGTGDILGLSSGETLSFLGLNWYSASGPLMVRAGRDIVGAGLPPGAFVTSATPNATSRGNLIVHTRATDVSVVSAGRDIINANFEIAGPGTLEIVSGRNLYQADKGGIVSIGPIATGDTRPGAGIAMLAGVGASGPDYDRLAALYLDPARLAVSGTPLADQPGKVAKTYEKELTAWLKERYGFAGSDADASAYFDALAPEQRHIFLRDVYFAELTAGGREYNDKSGPRKGSYLRGRSAIASLFPDAANYGGDLTMFGASGVRTLSGGDIQMLTPGGRTVIGVEALVPPATAGVVTQGSGNVQLYAQDSILLGLSRIMTTFGGDILAWSANGDINAGRGAKTTVVYTPPRRVYDQYGNVVLSPVAPSSGAGIATLAPIPEVPAGDIDLIAPLGTIDAGEAGIRVSGNINLAALQIVNAANIQVQGTSAGIPTVQGPPVAALATASNATAATQQAVTPAPSSNSQPSVMIVEIIGYGGSGEGNGDTKDEKKRGSDGRQGFNAAPPSSGYNDRSAVQIAGYGILSAAEAQVLTPEERKNLVKP